jgi:hypothetical protein
MPAKEKPMRLLLAVLTLATCSPAPSPSAPSATVIGDKGMAATASLGTCAATWLRRLHPFEAGNLSHLSPWTAYLVAEDQNPALLSYEAQGSNGTVPLYFGAGPPTLSLVRLDSRRFAQGMFYRVRAYAPSGECSSITVRVPQDHSGGQ